LLLIHHRQPLYQSLPPYYSIIFYEAVYIALKLLVFTNRPLIGNIYTYLTITEMTLIALSILLAYDVARALNEVEGVIEKVTFPKHGQRVLPITEAVEDVKVEFIRSRRHNRPLSLVVVDIDLVKGRTLNKQWRKFRSDADSLFTGQSG
jgi:hypothetical protein